MVKRVSVLAIFSFLLMGLLAPASLFAQQQTPQQAQDEDQWGEVVSAVNNIDQELQELQQTTDLTEDDVEVVDVSELNQQGQNPENLEQITTQNSQAIENLRRTISDNNPINQKLMAEGVSADNVIALDVEQDGTVTVYHQSS